MNQNLMIFCTILSCAGLFAWIVFPLLHRRRVGAGNALDELARERTDSLLESLNNLYAARERDQVSEEDFPSIERRLTLELARIYHKQGVNPDDLDNVHDQGDRCSSCGAFVMPDYKFCPQCGAKAAV